MVDLVDMVARVVSTRAQSYSHLTADGSTSSLDFFGLIRHGKHTAFSRWELYEEE
jgi:hypothetical protein